MQRGIAVLASFSVIAALAVSSSAADAEWTIDSEASVFAVVTHKEGLAAGLAHEHFVVADEFEVAIRPGGLLTAEDDTPGSAEIELGVERLRVDDPALASAWQERLLELDLIAEPFAELSEKDRRKIRQSMLGKKQLDAGSHPTIQASLKGVRRADDSQQPSRHVGTLSLTVRGETASRDVEFELDVGDEGQLRAELTAAFAFTDFGIEPYSAMLGAIRVADSFDVFVELVAGR